MFTIAWLSRHHIPVFYPIAKANRTQSFIQGHTARMMAKLRFKSRVSDFVLLLFLHSICLICIAIWTGEMMSEFDVNECSVWLANLDRLSGFPKLTCL